MDIPCFTPYNIYAHARISPHSHEVEKPRVFDPRGRVSLTPSGKKPLTLCGEIRMTPEDLGFSGVFCVALCNRPWPVD